MPHPNLPDSPDTRDALAPRQATPIAAFDNGVWQSRDDDIAVERALEIHVAGAAPIITMRTPGNDRALVAGLLHSEGVVETLDDIVYLKHSPDTPDVVRVMLKRVARDRLGQMERSTVATSACGVCGKPSFVPPRLPRHDDRQASAWSLSPSTLLALPDTLRTSQGVFASTGGIHAAGLFDRGGELCALHEDVGRHNALDKLIGAELLNEALPLDDRIVLLSGRASFELIQKAAMAGVAVVCAISAPSSYAVELARQADITLVGFLRDRRFNVYSSPWRIRQAPRSR